MSNWCNNMCNGLFYNMSYIYFNKHILYLYYNMCNTCFS